MISFSLINEDDAAEATALALADYAVERRSNAALYPRDYRARLEPMMRELFAGRLGVAARDENGILGYMALSGMWRRSEECGISDSCMPLHGMAIRHDADRGKLASMLFENTCAALMHKKPGGFNLRVYAHDEAVIRSFVLNQFGIIDRDEIRRTNAAVCSGNASGCVFAEWDKATITTRMDELLAIWHALVGHLRKGPCFYPGLEFTDEVYREYLMEEETRLFTACAGDRLVGVIDAAPDDGRFCMGDEQTRNVGDLFIVEDYRGRNAARELLRCCNDTLAGEGIERIWVNHGTTNPTALRFWGKYFSPFSCTLTRQLDDRIFDV